MSKQQVFPLILIILDLAAAIVYGVVDISARSSTG